MRTKRLLSMLVLLLTAVTGAWADDVAVTTVTLDETEKIVILNEAVALTATITPTEATDQKVKWTANNSNVAFYDDANCKTPTAEITELHTVYVKGLALGTTTVTVTSLSNPSATASCNIIVSNPYLGLYDGEDNTEIIAANDGKTYDVQLTRIMEPGVWTTFTAPFYISHDMMVETFGEEATVMGLRSSSLSGNELTLSFGNVWHIMGGGAYMVKPSKLVSMPLFRNVVITKNVDTESMASPYVDFVAVMGKTSIEGDEHSVIFLGGENALYYPSPMPAELNGFRCYFRVKYEYMPEDITVKVLSDGQPTEIVFVKTLDDGKPITEDIEEKPGNIAKPGETNTSEDGITITLDDDDSVDPEDGSVTMTTTLTSADIAAIFATYEPGSPEFMALFKGILFQVSAGKGKVEFEIETLGSTVLAVLNDLLSDTYTLASKGTITINYDNETDTWFFAYPIVETTSEARGIGAPAEDPGYLKVYSIKVMPSELANGIEETGRAKAGTGYIYNVNGQRVFSMKKGLYIIDGRKMVVK